MRNKRMYQPKWKILKVNNKNRQQHQQQRYSSTSKKIDGQNDVGINVIQGIKRNRKMTQPNKSNGDCIKKYMLLLLHGRTSHTYIIHSITHARPPYSITTCNNNNNNNIENNSKPPYSDDS